MLGPTLQSTARLRALMSHRVETGDQPRHTHGPEDTGEPGSLTNRSARPVTTGRSFQHPGARPQELPRAPPISPRCSTAASTVPAATPPHLLPPQPAWASQVRRVRRRRRLRTLRAEPGTQPSTAAALYTCTEERTCPPLRHTPAAAGAVGSRSSCARRAPSPCPGAHRTATQGPQRSDWLSPPTNCCGQGRGTP